jgi:hypothetical protein
MGIYTSISANEAEIVKVSACDESFSFLKALFQPDNAVLFRFIEVWQEDTLRKSKVHKTKYRLAKDLDGPGLGAMSQYAEATRSNQFFGVCPRLKDEEGFDLACQIPVVRVLWADLDHCTPEEAKRRCEAAGLPPPSIIVHSGHGVHLYWLLDEPVVIDGAFCEPIYKRYEDVKGKWRAVHYCLRGEDQKEVRVCPGDLLSPKAQEVQGVLQGIAGRVGGDHTQDLARLLRLPGTLNRKNLRNGVEPAPCRLVGSDPARRYPFAAFDAFKVERTGLVVADGEKKQCGQRPAYHVSAAWGDLRPEVQDELNRLLAECEFPHDGDRSRADFNLCREAIECGVGPEEVWDRVQDIGKFAERGPTYFDGTWAKAVRRVEQQFESIKDIIEDIRAKEQAAKKAALVTPPAPSGGSFSGEEQPGQRPLPVIVVNNRQLRDITQDALAAIGKANDPPCWFQTGNALARLRTDPDSGRPYLDALGDGAILDLLSQVADWKKVEFKKRENVEVHHEALPPDKVVKALIGRGEWPVPPITSITEAPVFGPSGKLVVRPGYDADARLWFQPAPGLDIPAVAEQPDQAEVADARRLLLGELLGDFRFADAASEAHALALLLLPFVRPMIGGPTPLYLIDAPTEGTGKGLLAKCMSVLATGREGETLSQPTDEAEWRKQLTSKLAEAPPYIWIDNIRYPLASGVLAKVLTDAVHEDRLLGVNRMVRVPVRCVWVATGNNVHAEKEIARRIVRIRLDARMELPHLRTGFRHPLPGWAVDHRGELVGACLTLAQAWLAAGRPAGNYVKGSYPEWARVVGGILDVAGVRGFLGNEAELFEAVNTSTAKWREFVDAWWDAYRDRAVSSGDLLTLLVNRQLTLLDELDGKNPRIQFGRWLGGKVDQCFGNCRIEQAADDKHKKVGQYKLSRLGADGPVAASDLNSLSKLTKGEIPFDVPYTLREDADKPRGSRRVEFHLTEAERRTLSREVGSHLNPRSDGSWSYRLKAHAN